MGSVDLDERETQHQQTGTDRSMKREEDEGKRSRLEPLLPAEASSYVTIPIPRFHAIDIFRGLTICLMIFANYGGGGYALFTHSAWNGLTIADLLFPWFAWIMGFSIFLAAHNQSLVVITRSTPPLSAIIIRTLKLFGVGLFLNNDTSWSHWRIPGVLQALGFAYFCVSGANWFFFATHSDSASQLQLSPFCRLHMLFGVLPLITTNLLLTFILPVPGCPTGYLGPGGTADDSKYQNCTGGAHLYIDRLVFGENHIYTTPTCQTVYHTGAYDPEGLLNWLMVATTAYIGYLQAAIVLQSTDSKQQRQSLLYSGTALLLTSIFAGGLIFFPEPWMPLNKNIWSISYVLLSSGLAAFVLALQLVLVDGANAKWSGYPLDAVGKNSIFIYVMHEICKNFAPFLPRPMNEGEALGHLGLLLYNFVGVICWIGVAMWMEAHQLFLKI